LQGQPLLQRRNLVVSASGCGLPVLEVGYIRPAKSPSKLLELVQLDSAANQNTNTIVPPTPDGFSWYEIHAVRSLEQAFAMVQQEARVFIIGGATIYQQTLSLADRLELTLVQGDYKGDALFPEYEELLAQKFTLTQRIERSQYRFETYIRKEG
jgi:dihydrofolate reductase